MMKSIRQKEITEILQRDKVINTSQMAAKYGVSIETIRRDLDQLEKQGILNKTYGGAELRTQAVVQPSPLVRRRGAAREAKAAIAAVAAEYISGKCTIALDAGSTMYELCPHLNRKEDLIIICSDIHSAARLLEGRGSRVYMMGGFLTPDGTSNGTYAKEFFNSGAGIDLFLFSADGAHPDEGLSTDESGINDLKKHYLKSARQRIALVDHTKFMRKGFYKTCDFTDLDVLITDSETPPEIVRRFRRKGIEVKVAEA